MANEILMEIETKGLGIDGVKLSIMDDGLHFSKTGIKTILSGANLHVTYKNISSVTLVKKMAGLQYDLVVTEVGGQKHFVEGLSSYDAYEGQRFIQEMQEYVLSLEQNEKNNNNNNSNSGIDFTEQLLNLAKLKDAGILSQEEFDEQKAKILASR
jgi:hypothetical protein